MDKEKLARYMEYQQLKQREREEQEYLNYLKHSLQPEQSSQKRDPDLPLNAEPVEPPEGEEPYGYKDAVNTLKKAKELEENKEYIQSLQPEKTKKPDYEKTFGETGNKVAEFIEDKISPLTAKDEDSEDYAPVDLMRTADAPLRALKVVDNVTGRPIRRAVYELLGGEPKKEVEGSDIRQQLETKTGKLNDIVGKPIELASDFLLDWTNLGLLGAIPLARKAGTKILEKTPAVAKLLRNPHWEEHLARIEANKAKNAATLEATKEAERVVKDTGKPRPAGFTKDQIFQLLNDE